MNCTYTSEWDNGSVVETPCEYDPLTGEVDPETADVDIDAGLVREFITLPDGEELEVCPNCHFFILKTVVGDRHDESYGEYKECSNPDCQEEF